MNQSTSEKRGHWYLLTGLIFGLLLGIIYSLAIAPADFVDVSPSMLNDELKDEYRGVVALAYQANGDIGRAQARLALLGDEEQITALLEQSQRILTAGGSRLTSQALLKLADDLKKMPEAVPTIQATQATIQESTLPAMPTTDEVQKDELQSQRYTEEVDISQVIRTPTEEPAVNDNPGATATIQPSVTPLPAQSMPFSLQERQDICDSALTGGLLQVEVNDESGEPVAGAQITITWDGGEEFFFTGLYPQISSGYADFDMVPGIQYRLRVGDGGEVVDDIEIPQCKAEDGSTAEGGLYLSFSP